MLFNGKIILVFNQDANLRQLFLFLKDFQLIHMHICRITVILSEAKDMYAVNYEKKIEHDCVRSGSRI